MSDLLLMGTILAICGGMGWPLAQLLPHSRFAWRGLLAPVFGFAAIAILTPVAYRAGVSLQVVFGGACVLAAVGVAWAAIRFRYCKRRQSDTERRLTCAAWVCAAVATLVLIAPRWVGGDQFAMFQGNHWDTLAYRESAAVYVREPYAVVSMAGDDQILRNPLYDYATRSLTNRPSAQMLYGVFTRVIPGQAYRLHYAYGVACFTQLVLVGLFVVRNLLPTASPIIWIIAPLVFPLGFWGQYVFDINSWSQTASAATLLLMAALFIHVTVAPEVLDEPPRAAFRLAAAIGILVAGAVYLYPEGFLIYAAGLGPVVATTTLVRVVGGRRIAFRPLLPLLGSAGVAIAGLYPPLLHHMMAQVTLMSTVQVNWWMFFQAFFRGRDGIDGSTVPFVVDFAGGLFGLYFATPLASAQGLIPVAHRLAIIGTIIALTVSVGLVLAGRAKLHRTREPGADSRRLLGAWVGFSILLLLLALELTLKGNYWPAGKIVSYAAPAFMTVMALPIAFNFGPGVMQILRWTAWGFVVFQLGSGVTRIAAAGSPNGIHYSAPYPSVQYPDLKVGLGWDFTALERVLTPETRVLVKPMDSWLEHHLLVFLWSRNIPFATASEVITGLGAGRKLGTLPPPWPPDVEISYRPFGFVLHFRDGRLDQVLSTSRIK